MAQLNDLYVSGSARFLKTINGTVNQALSDENGNNISTTYMKKGVDYVTAGKKSGSTLGTKATAEGMNVVASGNYSHAEGYETTALGIGTHAEGYQTNVSYYSSDSPTYAYSHAEGSSCVVNDAYSHAEGTSSTISQSMYAHAEGKDNYITGGTAGHAEGHATTLSQSYSTVYGKGNIANGYYQLVIGEYNFQDANSAFIIGSGSDNSNRLNIFKVSTKGMITTTKGIVPSTRMASAQTIPNLLNELRYLNGAMGSMALTTAYPVTSSVSIPTGWYNYIYIPHRVGGADGAAAGDNCNYGGLLLLGMTVGGVWFIRYSNGAIASVQRYTTS